MFRLFECCALSFFERFVLSFSLKIERFVSDSAEIWICGLYTYLATQNLGVRFSTDYDVAPPVVRSSRERLHKLTFSMEVCAVF